MSKPTIVIVSGAWQTPGAWSDLRHVASNDGYETVHITLPTIGSTTTPQPTLVDDVTAVRAVLNELLDDRKDVVLLCHSSGGVVGSNVVEGLDRASRKAAGHPGGVVHMVFLSAFALPKGKSLLEMLGGQPLVWMVVQGDRVTAEPGMVPNVAFNDLQGEKLEQALKELTHMSAALFATPSGFEPWTNGIPCSYIFLEKDNALPLNYQEQMASQFGPQVKTSRLPSGHCPHQSMPSELLRVLEDHIGTGYE